MAKKRINWVQVGRMTNIQEMLAEVMSLREPDSASPECVLAVALERGLTQRLQELRAYVASKQRESARRDECRSGREPGDPSNWSGINLTGSAFVE